MKALGRGLIAALAVVCLLAVVVPPALATVGNTTSVMNTRPFFTPMGNTTTSSSTLRAARIDISGTGFDGRAITITCVSVGSGYVAATHTSLTITDLLFRTCISDAGTVSALTTDANSATPYFLHVTSTVVADPASWNTTLVIPLGRRISVADLTLTGGGVCGITIGGQSLRSVDTNAGTVTFNDPTMRFILDPGFNRVLCPDPRLTLSFSGVYTIAPDTAADRFRSTALS